MKNLSLCAAYIKIQFSWENEHPLLRDGLMVLARAEVFMIYTTPLGQTPIHRVVLIKNNTIHPKNNCL